ncbi:hypothetical protein N0O92_01485 [Alkalihalobacillus sp. MEB130]|uniref:hypothetical protein n=1 Tax=Alkalihalobacillus sp. MEB130 TaxID=2976704 RepID=UPI0028DE56C2|nr:hypothetical protein [Alkalihalobacillus sp. MEB130]MDT8858883.1 hypothetical protein [Alkalihalobacillus sp. MEB130]
MIKKLLIVVFLCTSIGIWYAVYHSYQSYTSTTNQQESPIQELSESENYINYVYHIIGDLDRRMTVSATILYAYSDGNITRESALQQIEEHVAATEVAHNNYVPYDTSQFDSADQTIISKIESTIEKSRNLYVDLQNYMKEALDQGEYVYKEDLTPLTSPATDLIIELNELRDQLLDLP